MLDPESILRLYANVLHNDIAVNAVSEREIRKSVQSMGHVYAPENNTFDSSVLKFLNFNDIACRCAYLHKYAPLHTYIVFDAMLKIFQKEISIFRNLVAGNNQVLRLCSIGGGPGSDVIGVLSALKVVFETFRASVSIVDCMENWGSTFEEVVQELKFGGYGSDWYCFANDLNWNYIGANLLCKMSDEVNAAIGSASLITMMKFISASVCTNTEEMVDKIFRVMKLGALVLYIDNAAGGFTQLIERSGRRNGLVPVFGPLRHVQYDTEALKVHRFGYNSCFQTKVTIILLQKKYQNRKRGASRDPDLVERNTKKLDFVVFDQGHPGNQYPLDVNLYTADCEFDDGVDSMRVDKCSEKLTNNLRTNPPPAKRSNVDGTFQYYPGALAQTTTTTTPPRSTHVIYPRKSYPAPVINPPLAKRSNVDRTLLYHPGTSAQTTTTTTSQPRSSHVTYPRKSNPAPAPPKTPHRAPQRTSRPVTRTPSGVAIPRYQPVSRVANNAPPREQPPDDICCSCCVIS